MRPPRDLDSRTERFVSDLSAAARDVVATAMAKAQAAAVRSAPPVLHSPRRRRAMDRGAAVARAASYLLAKPGVGAAELRRVLGVDAHEMRAIIGDLVGQRLVTFKGNTRGRTYFATSGVTTRARRAPTTRRRAAASKRSR